MEAADLLRGAIVWNLALELGRAGAAVEAVIPTDVGVAQEDPTLGVRVSGAHVADWVRAAGQARSRLAERASLDAPGVLLAGLAAAATAAAAEHADRALLCCATGPAALERAEVQGRRWLEAGHDRLGVVIHGAGSLREARRSFERLAGPLERVAGQPVASFGLLVDDLALYRSLVERRPVGLTRPQSPAGRALADVARLVLAPEDSP
jgi:MinD-like ATPase involved in chromosome partitioning or flagellar assembly